MSKGLVTRLFIAGILAFLLYQQTHAASITLTPFDGYLGEIPDVVVCSFSYSPGTELAPGTRLTIDPYSETYGIGSVVKPEDGLSCGSCMVPRTDMDAAGVTTIHCEQNK